MVFSETAFLFLFFPLFFALYFVLPVRWRNGFLLGASLFFYAWGDVKFLPLLLFSIGLNFFFGLAIEKGTPAKRKLLAAGVTGNIAILAYFKYFYFIASNTGFEEYGVFAPALPIGISFFTFQGISYLIDVSRGHVAAQRSVITMALYISMFPQLLAGPIVRYSEVQDQLLKRTTTRTDFSEGMQRFVVGLAKKTLIADPLSRFVDRVFALAPEAMSPELAWVAGAAFMLQIFFDFAAYSDMAIGMGRMLGFRFPENFNYPFTAKSVSEFWMRWHMTLSRWFRDYVLFPLVGRRPAKAWALASILIVFFLTGLWHGAAWTFAIWGLYNGAFLVLERLGLRNVLKAIPPAAANFYLLFVVLTGAIMFRADDMSQVGTFYKAMFLLERGEASLYFPFARYFHGHLLVVLIAAVLLSAPLATWQRMLKLPNLAFTQTEASKVFAFWVLVGASIISVGASNYTPFLYFRF